jgi:hypothetical protein
MKNRNALPSRAPCRYPPITCAATLAVAFATSLPMRAYADAVTPPPVPANIQVPAGNKVFLVGHAVGTQNYSCLPAGVDAAGHPRFAWTLFTPQATLFADNRKEVITHYFSPNPSEASPNPFANGLIRATWQDSRTRAPSGGRWCQVIPPPTRLSSHRVPLPG